MRTIMALSLINLIACAAIVCLMPFIMAYAPETFMQHATTLFLTTLLASFVGMGSLVVICHR